MRVRSRPISLSQTTLAMTSGEKSWASNTMRGRRRDSGEMSGACACRSANASSGVMATPRRDWKRANWTASDSGSRRLAIAAYLTAGTSMSGVRLLLSSATTRRPSAARPRTLTRSRSAPAVGRPSNSKEMTLMPCPRMMGFDSTHSCRSARSSSPASSSEIIWAGIATDPATVNSISSAMCSVRVRQGARGGRNRKSQKVSTETQIPAVTWRFARRSRATRLQPATNSA